MSFATETKKELTSKHPDKTCCKLAEIAGFIRVSGSIRLKGNGSFVIVLTTERPDIAGYYIKAIQDYFGIRTSLEVKTGSGIKKNRQCKVTIDPDNKSDQILREIGILQVKGGYNTLTDGIFDSIIRKKCCKKAFLRGMFMGAGSINDPSKGYHLEIVCNRERLAKDLKRMINTFDDLSVKISKRKDKYVVYMTNFNYIADTLALIGAHGQLFKLEDRKIQNEVKSRATRMVNCDNANIDRAANASDKQIEAIKKVDKLYGIDKLPPQLKELAELRLLNPDANMTQLGEMMSPALGKSGVYKRMNKIIKMAGM